jgi:hypothetical protein
MGPEGARTIETGGYAAWQMLRILADDVAVALARAEEAIHGRRA